MKIKCKRIPGISLIILALMLIPVLGNCQFSRSNGNPPSIHWKEISNPSARIIFPEGLEQRAFHVADVIDYLNKNGRSSMGQPKGRISIILQNQLTQSNGFVTLAPFHSEFFTTAPQHSFAGTTDWLDLLAIHEYRHVMQFQHARQGVTKIANWLFGEFGWLGLGLFSLPSWYLEGDATMQETLLSRGGRGRSGAFLAEFRALHAAGVKYSYEKMRNGSFKSILPSRYPLGYLFSYYGRKLYGDTLWRDVETDASRYKGIVWPFSQALKRRTGMGTHTFYNFMMDTLYKQWDKANSTIDFRQQKAFRINAPISPHRITFYRYPKFYNHGVITLRSGRDRSPRFEYIHKDGTSEKLLDLGYHSGYFSVRGSKMVWAENEPDIRWANRYYSVIYVYDFISHKKKKLTRKTKYFSPSISPDGKRIAVVQSGAEMQYEIRILDAVNGKLLRRLPNPENYFLSTPRWKNREKLLAVGQYQGRNALLEIDIPTGEMTPLIPFTNNIILDPVAHGDEVYFAGDFARVRNIYSLDTKTGNLYRITSSKVLADQPDVSEDGKYLLYSERQIYGSDIKKIKLASENRVLVDIVEPYVRYRELQDLASEEGGPVLDKVPVQNYEVRDYPQLKEVIHVHSWLPSIDRIYQKHSKGFGGIVRSDNLLSTWTAILQGYVNRSGETKLGIALNWSKYFPILSLNYDLTTLRIKQNNSVSPLLIQHAYSGIEIPLNFSRGAWSRSLIININEGIRTFHSIDEDAKIPETEYLFGSALSFTNIKAKGYQQLGPRFGQQLNVEFKSCCNFKDLDATFPLSLDARLYFPGLRRTHSFQLSGHYHERKIYGYSGNGLRGYTTIVPGPVRRASVDYSFPIAYPDYAFGPFLYIPRVRGNIFYDRGFVSDNTGLRLGESTMGIELSADVALLNLGEGSFLPFGIRVSYLPDAPKHYNIEFIFK